MALQRVNHAIDFKKWKGASKGTTYEGWIKGYHTSQQFGSKSILLETRDGKVVGLPLSGQLKYILAEYGQGDYIQIVYGGMETITRAGRPTKAHQFEVYVDPEMKRTASGKPTPRHQEEIQKDADDSYNSYVGNEDDDYPSYGDDDDDDDTLPAGDYGF